MIIHHVLWLPRPTSWDPAALEARVSQALGAEVLRWAIAECRDGRIRLEATTLEA